PAGHAQTFVALITHQRVTRFRSENAIDLSVIITGSRQLILDVSHRRSLVRTRAVSALIIGIGVTLIVVVRLIVVIVVSALVVGSRLIVNAGIIAIGAVGIGIIVIVGVGIVVGPAVPRDKSEIEDEPGIVHPTATMSLPPMVAVTVPIAMPISRPSREDMLASLGAIIIGETIAAGSLERTETSVVLRSRETV